MGQTNTLLDRLNAQVANSNNFPNIQPVTYNNLQRILLRYWLRTYGVNYSLNGSTSVAPGASTNPAQVKSLAKAQAVANAAPVAASNISNPTYFLVLAVHGAITNRGTVVNQTATGNNIVYIANHMVSFPPNTSLTLNTPNNQNVPVTVKQYRGNGAIEVNEELVLDILQINSGGTDYNKNYASFPYLLFSQNLIK